MFLRECFASQSRLPMATRFEDSKIRNSSACGDKAPPGIPHRALTVMQPAGRSAMNGRGGRNRQHVRIAGSATTEGHAVPPRAGHEYAEQPITTGKEEWDEQPTSSRREIFRRTFSDHDVRPQAVHEQVPKSKHSSTRTRQGGNRPHHRPPIRKAPEGALHTTNCPHSEA